MEVIGLIFLPVIIICIFAATAVSAFFIWIGSKFAGVPESGFGRAFVAAIASSITVWALTGAATALFGIGSVAGWFLGILITLGMLKWIYATGWGKAFLIWIFTGIAHVIVGVILVVLVITGVLVMAL
ncbi:MAG: hypothetical protein JW838_04120 [Spirochaetes bacterium]|nr:hypothetical protein [Spirochaetota bacterium]